MIKISIITATYNSENTILRCLKSIDYQIYNNLEHIIVDGNSTDNTIKICNEFSKDLKIISENDKGVYDAFNKGLKMASGDVVGFLNSDDVFYNDNSLKTIVDGFDENTDAIFGNLKFYNKKNKVVRKWMSKPFENGAFEKGWMPAHPTFYCRKIFYDELGRYNDSFKIAGDFELMLRFIQVNKIKTKFINKNLIKMEDGGISNSGLLSKIIILKEEFKSFNLNSIRINKIIFIFNKMKKIKEFSRFNYL